MGLEFTYHTDPGHGWVEVKRSSLIELDVDLSKISYSYQSRDGRTVYLEEDCAVVPLIEAMKAKKISYEFKVLHTNNEHWIRGLPYFRMDAQ